MDRRYAIKLTAGCTLLAAAAGVISACSQDQPKFRNIDITGADYAKDFQLADQNGQVRTLKDFRGKVVVLFFGYT
ncbi:MAG: SCO family protein, partial [Gammaproteobacteria bacterium]